MNLFGERKALYLFIFCALWLKSETDEINSKMPFGSDIFILPTLDDFFMYYVSEIIFKQII